MDTEQGWSDYWQSESPGGEVFVDGQGNKHPALGEFWVATLSQLAEGSRVMDLASGAGSIYGHLPESHGLLLSAADISPQALDALNERIAGVSTFVCPADAVPVDDHSFDLVVSQFGVEYAGVGAFGESARLVAPGGRFTALAHIRDGYIDSRNAAELAEARVVLESRFIDLSLALVDAAVSGADDRKQAAEQAFIPAAHTVAAAIRRCDRGVHKYLFAGFRELFENRNQYDPSDIKHWLEGMRGEVDKAVERLAHMRSIALSADDIDSILVAFDAAGLVDGHADKFFTPGNDKPVAWQIRATRPVS
ncbi:MAG: methyltransferase domain-containing protein [Pseudomonadota bacterium]